MRPNPGVSFARKWEPHREGRHGTTTAPGVSMLKFSSTRIRAVACMVAPKKHVYCESCGAAHRLTFEPGSKLPHYLYYAQGPTSNHTQHIITSLSMNNPSRSISSSA